MTKRCILAILVLISTVALSFAQVESKNGHSINPHGSYMFVAIFVNIIYDIHTDPIPGNSVWGSATVEGFNINPPIYAATLFANSYSTIENEFYSKSNRLYEASFGRLKVLGDGITVNIKQSTLSSDGLISINEITTGVINYINASGGLNAVTTNNFNSISDYDLNSNEGIAGIAPNCKIMPIRWDITSSSLDIADGIIFAVENGARIISNSWGYAKGDNNLHPVQVSAIQYAIDNNVVVLFSAGNNLIGSDPWDVAFPANANINSLITVGACDRDNLKTHYSPTSSLIDVVAPSNKAYPPAFGGLEGETQDMWTIDPPLWYGWNPWRGSYSPPQLYEYLPNSGPNYHAYSGRFGGTSHSCPVVAGVVALMLSEDPDLTPAEVFNILINTANKIGPYNYVNGRCNQTGYGRVNAFSALQAVCTSTQLKDQSISTNTTIEDCDIIIHNVIVVNNSTLILNAEEETKITGNFELTLGSELVVL